MAVTTKKWTLFWKFTFFNLHEQILIADIYGKLPKKLWNQPVLTKIINSLHLKPMFHFYFPWKRQKTRGKYFNWKIFYPTFLILILLKCTLETKTCLIFTLKDFFNFRYLKFYHLFCPYYYSGAAFVVIIYAVYVFEHVLRICCTYYMSKVFQHF